jgi:hypothetical protein
MFAPTLVLRSFCAIRRLQWPVSIGMRLANPMAPEGGSISMSDSKDKLVALAFGFSVLAFAAFGYASMLVR